MCSSRILFFFSSRRRHTRYIGDWSSDVCSSDLEFFWFPHTEWAQAITSSRTQDPIAGKGRSGVATYVNDILLGNHAFGLRSEERRVGKEGRTRWSRGHIKEKRGVETATERLQTR